MSSSTHTRTHGRRCRTNHTHSSAQTHNQNRAEPPCQTNYWNINGSDRGKIGPIWIGNGWMILIGISTQNRTLREPPSFSPTKRLLLKKIHKTSQIISFFWLSFSSWQICVFTFPVLHNKSKHLPSDKSLAEFMFLITLNHLCIIISHRHY